MRFYTKPHQHYCGIDLHAETMYLCILDREGQIPLQKNLRSRPGAFLEAVAPFRDDLVVAVECTFTRYWLTDLCRREGIESVLGHALYRNAIHGGKAKNDKADAFEIAALLRGGNLPQTYFYPPEMRATRDLLRRRPHLAERHRRGSAAESREERHGGVAGLRSPQSRRRGPRLGTRSPAYRLSAFAGEPSRSHGGTPRPCRFHGTLRRARDRPRRERRSSRFDFDAG